MCLGDFQMELSTLLVWAVALVILYIVGSKLVKKKTPKQNDSAAAPYKVEPAPVVTAEPTPEVAAEVKPELKVVSGAKKVSKSRTRKSPAKRASEKTPQFPLERPAEPPKKPRASRKPKNV